MLGNVIINQPSDLGIGSFDRINRGTFFKFISPTGVQPTGLCVKISKEELFDFKRQIKYEAGDMKLMDVQIMAVNITARPDYGPSLRTSYDDKFIRTKTLEFPGEDAKSENDCSE